MNKLFLLAIVALAFSSTTIYAQDDVNKETPSEDLSEMFSTYWGEVIVQTTPDGRYSIVAGSSYDSENGIQWFYPESGVLEFVWENIASNLIGNKGSINQSYQGKGTQNMTFEILSDCSSISLYKSFDKTCMSLSANNNTFTGAMFMASDLIEMQEGDVTIECSGQWRFKLNEMFYTYYFKPVEE